MLQFGRRFAKASSDLLSGIQAPGAFRDFGHSAVIAVCPFVDSHDWFPVVTVVPPLRAVDFLGSATGFGDLCDTFLPCYSSSAGFDALVQVPCLSFVVREPSAQEGDSCVVAFSVIANSIVTIFLQVPAEVVECPDRPVTRSRSVWQSA